MNIYYFCLYLGVFSVLLNGVTSKSIAISNKPQSENVLNDIFRIEGCILWKVSYYWKLVKFKMKSLFVFFFKELVDVFSNLKKFVDTIGMSK